MKRYRVTLVSGRVIDFLRQEHREFGPDDARRVAVDKGCLIVSNVRAHDAADAATCMRFFHSFDLKECSPACVLTVECIEEP